MEWIPEWTPTISETCSEHCTVQVTSSRHCHAQGFVCKPNGSQTTAHHHDRPSNKCDATCTLRYITATHGYGRNVFIVKILLTDGVARPDFLFWHAESDGLNRRLPDLDIFSQGCMRGWSIKVFSVEKELRLGLSALTFFFSFPFPLALPRFFLEGQSIVLVHFILLI